MSDTEIRLVVLQCVMNSDYINGRSIVDVEQFILNIGDHIVDQQTNHVSAMESGE